MRMKLRRGVAVYGTGGVMLELRRDKPPSRLGRMVAPDPGLRVFFQFIQGDVDGLAVCLTYAVIATYESCQRDGLRGGKGSIPTGTMLDRRDHLSLCVAVFMDDTM